MVRHADGLCKCYISTRSTRGALPAVVIVLVVVTVVVVIVIVHRCAALQASSQATNTGTAIRSRTLCRTHAATALQSRGILTCGRVLHAGWAVARAVARGVASLIAQRSRAHRRRGSSKCSGIKTTLFEEQCTGCESCVFIFAGLAPECCVRVQLLLARGLPVHQ